MLTPLSSPLFRGVYSLWVQNTPLLVVFWSIPLWGDHPKAARKCTKCFNQALSDNHNMYQNRFFSGRILSWILRGELKMLPRNLPNQMGRGRPRTLLLQCLPRFVLATFDLLPHCMTPRFQLYPRKVISWIEACWQDLNILGTPTVDGIHKCCLLSNFSSIYYHTASAYTGI